MKRPASGKLVPALIPAIVMIFLPYPEQSPQAKGSAGKGTPGFVEPESKESGEPGRSRFAEPESGREAAWGTLEADGRTMVNSHVSRDLDPETAIPSRGTNTIRTTGASAYAQEKAEEKKILYVVEDSLPYSLNPLVATTMPEYRTNELVHDSLFLMGEDWNLRSSLISTRNGQPDVTVDLEGRWLEGKLKTAYFHDGSQITVDDLKASLLAYRDAAGRFLYADYLKGLFTDEGIIRKNDLEFRIDFSRPVSFPKEVLTIKMLPRRAFGTTRPYDYPLDAKYRDNPVGAGPFKVVGLQEGASGQRATGLDSNLNLVLHAFEQYHHGRPKLDEIQIMAVPSNSAKVDLLTRGQAQVVVSVPKVDQKRARDAGAWTVPYFVRNWWFLGFNCQSGAQGAFADPAVRRALAQAIDRVELARQLGDDIQETSEFGVNTAAGPDDPQGEPGARDVRDPSVVLLSGPFVQESPNYNFKVPHVKFDSRAAREALAKIPGFKYRPEDRSWDYKGRELKLNLAYRQDLPEGQDVAVVLKQMFADIGITVRLFNYSHAQWKEKVMTLQGHSSIDMFLGRFFFDAGDDIYPFFHPQGQFNIFRFKDPDVGKLLTDARNARDRDERVTTLREVHALIADRMPCLFLWEANQVAAFRKEVGGFKIHSFSFYVNPHRWYLRERRPGQ